MSLVRFNLKLNETTEDKENGRDKFYTANCFLYKDKLIQKVL